jgi:hypothetical protein
MKQNANDKALVGSTPATCEEDQLSMNFESFYRNSLLAYSVL